MSLSPPRGLYALLSEHHPTTLAGRHDHCTPPRRLDASTRRFDVKLLEQRPQDCAHLDERKVTSRAGLASAAPRHPYLGARSLIKKALWTERLGIAIHRRVVLHQMDAANQMHGRAVGVPAYCVRLGDDARDREQEHRPMTQDLAHDRIEVIAVPVIQLRDQSLSHGRVVREQLDRPGQLRARRLVSGEDERHDRVAYFADHLGAARDMPGADEHS